MAWRKRPVASASRASGPNVASSSMLSNPFEVKINRQKFHILGRKTRHDVGRPGVMRSKAHKKRTQTLMKEYKEKGKSNIFKDKRFGEYDNKISPEEKMMKRFALEQQKNYEKKHIYNLNEEEDLTHYGHSLANIEKLDDVVDSESDTEERGMLSAELTAAHFGGGGLLRKKTFAEQQDEENTQAKSRKELIEELIAKSKQEKRERQTQRENTEELTEKLNSDWKEIQDFLFHRTAKLKMESHVEEKLKPDEYDIMVRELGFEMKVQPSNRMKTEEELANEEKEQLLKLEADRLRRMHGENVPEVKKNPKHMSADDLADGFLLDKDDSHFISYKDGKLNTEDDKEEQEEKIERTEGDIEEEESDESDAESEVVDSHSDWEADAEEITTNEVQKKQVKSKKNKFHTKLQNSAREAAKLELPYLFDAPESYEQLKALLSEKPIEEQLLVIERIQKSNHPSLVVGNKAKLEKLFAFLLEYVGELACKEPPELKAIDNLVQVLYNLCQMFPTAASNHVKFILQDAMHDLEKNQEVKGRAAFPGLDMLIYLKIIGVLFPASDFWHPVVTPTLVYMSQLLTKCPVTTLQDVVKGLFVCCLFLEYVSLSQRFVPELINFLLGILHMAVPNAKVKGSTLKYPFGSLKKQLDLLVISEKADIETWQKQSFPLHMINRLKEKGRIELNHLRLSCLGLCLDLIKRCAALYGLLPSFHEIMQPIETLLNTLTPVKQYPKLMQKLCSDVLKQLKVKGQYYPLVCEKKKPVPLKIFTPKLVKVMEFGRKQESNKKEQERKLLIHKHKRELKGAVREIRKDNQFLARMQLAETMERDSERKRKVKQLFSSLAQQEGDWKAMKRKKF